MGFVVCINLCTLIPLMLILHIPNEEQMNAIAVKLREAAGNRLQIEENDDENENDNVLQNGSRGMIDENDMVRLYFVCVDHLFPFLKHMCCASCIHAKDKEAEHDTDANANQ